MAASLKVAVTQAEPAWLDLAASVEKACLLIAEAASNGAKLAAPVNVELQTRYIYNSLSITSPEMQRIQDTAKDHFIAVVLGFSERSPSNSIYIAQAIITPQGELAMHRRKLKPTHMERTIFGDGSGADLDNVVEIDFGPDTGKVKVGCLACWEHTRPLLKYHTVSQGETVHVSMWPPVEPAAGPTDKALWSMTADGCLNMSQTYAVEGAVYVLHCTAPCSEKGVETMGTKHGLSCRQAGGGHSCVLAPDGRRITAPVGDGKAETEGILYADLDLSSVVATRGFLDIVGHYSRPDLLWLGVDKQQKTVVVAKP